MFAMLKWTNNLEFVRYTQVREQNFVTSHFGAAFYGSIPVSFTRWRRRTRPAWWLPESMEVTLSGCGVQWLQVVRAARTGSL
jgi:hypothetical protein